MNFTKIFLTLALFTLVLSVVDAQTFPYTVDPDGTVRVDATSMTSGDDFDLHRDLGFTLVANAMYQGFRPPYTNHVIVKVNPGPHGLEAGDSNTWGHGDESSDYYTGSGDFHCRITVPSRNANVATWSTMAMVCQQDSFIEVWHAKAGYIDSASSYQGSHTFRITCDPQGTGNCVSLPVALAEFTSSYQNYKIQANWTTAFETNNDYFRVDVYRDKELVHTARVAAGDTMGDSYSYEYIPRETGSYHVELHDVDMNGFVTHLGTEPVYVNELSPWMLVSGNGTASPGWKLENCQQARIRVFSMGGRCVWQETVQTTGDFPSGLTPGAYGTQIEFLGDRGQVTALAAETIIVGGQ